MGANTGQPVVGPVVPWGGTLEEPGGPAARLSFEPNAGVNE